MKEELEYFNDGQEMDKDDFLDDNYVYSKKYFEEPLKGEGKYKKYDECKDVFCEGSIINNLNEGDYIEYDIDGNIHIKAKYHKGVLHGKYQVYFSDNQLEEELNYDNGKLVGQCKKYNDTGELLSDILFINGKCSGEVNINNKYGQKLVSCFIKDNKLEGKYDRFVVSMKEISNFTSSCMFKIRLPYKLIHTLNFKNNKLNGECLVYNEYENLIGKGSFSEGEPIGIHQFFHYNKQLYYQICFDNSEIKEPIIFYNPDGSEINELTNKEKNCLDKINNKEYLQLYNQIPSREIPLYRGTSSSWNGYNKDSKMRELIHKGCFDEIMKVIYYRKPNKYPEGSTCTKEDPAKSITRRIAIEKLKEERRNLRK